MRNTHTKKVASTHTKKIALMHTTPLPTVSVPNPPTLLASIPVLPTDYPHYNAPPSPSLPSMTTPRKDRLPFGILLSEIATHPLQWLWQDRIPLGHLTLLEGPPGIGTSLLALHLAACISSKQPLPDGTTSPSTGVVIVAPHDSATHTIIPRLHTFNADLSHILVLSNLNNQDPYCVSDDNPFSLPDHLDLLETAIEHMEASLVILDSIPTIFSKSPAARHTIFTRLKRLANRSNCAILLIRPTTTRTVPRPTASVGPLDLLSTVRSSLLLLPDPEDHEHRLLISTKHSLSARPSPLLLAISPTAQGRPSIEWLGEHELPTAATSPQSLHCQLILKHLHDSPTPLDARALADHTCHDYHATRKMLQRMTRRGPLLSPTRGLYTIPAHPTLSNTHTAPATPPVPNVPSVPTEAHNATSYKPDASHPRPIPADALDQTTYRPDESHPSPVPSVPTAQPDTLDVPYATV